MFSGRKQGGFVTLPLMGWLAVAAGAAILALSVALKVQSSRLDAAKADLEACATRYETALASIRKQNEAVTALSEASAKRQKQAAIALKQAREGQGKADAEIARLKGLADKGLSCSGAVQQVKRGMQP